ncbi:hypothetical protein JCM8547_006859 [Rhodosporidiobolus lusitaniae]
MLPFLSYPADWEESAPTPASSLVVVVLSAREDKFDQSYLQQGETGGHLAARKLHKVLEEKIEKGEKKDVKMLVYYVAEAKGQGREFNNFLRGFSSSTSKFSMVVPPGGGKDGSLDRVSQLLDTYLPIPFVSDLILGRTTSETLVEKLEVLPDEQREKVAVLSTSSDRLLEGENAFARFELDQGLLVKEETSVEAVDRAEAEQGSSPTHSSPLSPRAPGWAQRFVPTAALPAPLPVPDGPFEPPRMRFSNPRPCFDYYLAPTGCKKRSHCRFSHHYPFTRGEWDLFPKYAKSIICPFAAEGVCKWEKCYNAHACPYTIDRCRWGADCRFLQSGLPHSELQHGHGWDGVPGTA